ncbi:type 1 glutamine amidotransferase domain-containing protein [Paenibacillus sp. LMG 31456]|uniref:Type 1 glutamine amidotransferase domain-containing protein n=1 Tax=Paenibacillus foliorum TaxID=2654974 RepID=A0A972K5T6_9BACL|nr:type 1 glutamine amidotransferase domain-containing protein [Paenibacillus foliorum]
MNEYQKDLIVVTSHQEIQPELQTGLWLSEFVEVYDLLINAGHQVTVASMKGGKTPIDPNSLPQEGNAERISDHEQLQDTVLLKELSSNDFDAIYLPGGHRTMFDFANDISLQNMVREFAQSDRIVAAVCHGLSGFVGVTLSNGESFVKGKTLTSFTNNEEQTIQLDSLMPFLLEDGLRQLGANFISAPIFSEHVITDGNLITGQNPQSSTSLGKALLERLEAK